MNRQQFHSFNMRSAEEIFRNFFNGHDPFADFFNDDEDDFFGGGMGGGMGGFGRMHTMGRMGGNMNRMGMGGG